MSDPRRLRADYRTRHDGKVPPSQIAPVRQLSKEEIEAMDPNTPTPRRNVTAEENAKLAAQREPPPRTLGEMQRDALKVLNRELAFVEQASDAALAGNGTLSNEQWVRFKDAMGVIKQHLVEERSAPPVDPTKLTEEQLQAEIEKRKIADAKDWVASR